MRVESFLDRLSRGVVLFDGATGTQFQAAGLTEADFVLPGGPELPARVQETSRRLAGLSLEGCNEVLCFSRPDVVAGVHRAYFEAGADMAETNSFGSLAPVLGEYDIPELDYACSLASAQIARRVADECSTPGKPRFVAGGIGPGTKLMSLGQISWEEINATVRRSAKGLIEGGADVLLIETMQDLLMVKACIVAATEAMEESGRTVPLMVQVTVEQTGTMLVGSDLAAALNMVESFPQVVAIGMNCATGPQEMVPHIKFLCENSTRPVSVQPNAGLPVMEQGKAAYKLTPAQLADFHEMFVNELGAAFVGGCCGTTPAHISEVAKRLDGKPHSGKGHWQTCRNVFPGFDFSIHEPTQANSIRLKGCSSLYQFVPYEQDSSFLIIGERTNANGSKAFKDMLAAENWTGLTELARELEGEGSHVIDVCTAYVGRNEVQDMQTLLKAYNQHVTVPVMVDSTEFNVIEAALKTLAGKPIVNSINFEDGEERTKRVLALCRKYGAAVVGLTIDETGMAKTVEEKVNVAGRLVEAVRAFGMADHDLFIDCLTFTLGSGDEDFRKSGQATIDAIQQLKSEFPAVNFVLGVSNISFGLKPAARVALNSAFLHYAVQAGLTSAIVHFSKILPENRIDPEVWQIASDLVWDKRRYA